MLLVVICIYKVLLGDIQSSFNNLIFFFAISSGNPGSGKTTSCHSLKDILSDIGCFVLPFDGYHIPMADLEASPNAEDLIYRRGAPDTFYPGKLLDDIKRIKNSRSESIIRIPGFDHEKGDPEPDQHEDDDAFEEGRGTVAVPS